jgi:ABC-2 type transport system permease protein
VSAASGLARRELVRLWRQPSRLIATVGTPAMLWIFFASGFAGSFDPPAGAAEGAETYAAFFLPGAATLAVLFASIFAAMSLIQDRSEGFLQAALVSPAPRASIALAKAAGATIVALLQAIVLLAPAPLVGLEPSPLGFALAAAGLALTAAAVTSLGLALAWIVNSSEGFHGVMNGLLMPMWLLSGALFPVDSAAPWLALLASINPLTWCTTAVRASLTGAEFPTLSWIGAALFAAASVALAARVMSTRSSR